MFEEVDGSMVLYCLAVFCCFRNAIKSEEKLM